MKNILLVDDETTLLRILRGSLTKKGYTVLTAANGQEARQRIREQPIDIAFLDVMLPDTTGLDLLQEFGALYPNKIFVIMTAFSNIENAVTAVKAGAFDYIVKPAKLDEILLVIEKASEWIKIKQENRLLKEKLQNVESGILTFGASPAMRKIYPIIERVAATDATVLLEGESGTGKTMIALLIHKLSVRSQAPFISINCAAIPEQLLESELFGYEKGAFTGATTSHVGKFEAANGGTIFLDEIGEINATLQAKLLQVTQEKSFMRLGSNTLRQVNLRIISATNRGLKKLVESGSFREDLFYRLNIVDIVIPPLRERQDDIPFLIEEFLKTHRKRDQKDYQLSPELMQILKEHHWPGNVRELQNAMERAVVLCQGTNLSIEDFPREVRESSYDTPSREAPTFELNKSLPDQLEEIEKTFIREALKETHGQAAAAARKLGISRQCLLYKKNKYFIS